MYLYCASFTEEGEVTFSNKIDVYLVSKTYSENNTIWPMTESVHRGFLTAILPEQLQPIRMSHFDILREMHEEWPPCVCGIMR